MHVTRFARASAATICAALLCLSGCTKLLKANFNADTVGQRPNASLPGHPVGDSIYFSDPNSPGSRVIYSLEMGSNAFQYINVERPAYSKFVGFMSRETTWDRGQQVVAKWTGSAHLKPGTPLDIWLGNDHYQSLAAIRLQEGKVLLKTSEADPPTFEQIGEYPASENHTFYISVSKSTGKYAVKMIPGTVDVGDRPVLTPAVLDTHRPTLWLLYEGTSNDDSKYTMDDLTITQSNR